MTDKRCLEIVSEITVLMNEFKEKMPDEYNINLAWQFVGYSLQSLWHRMYHHDTNEIWFNTPKETEEVGFEL